MKKIFKIVVGALAFGSMWATTAQASPITFGGSYAVTTSSGLTASTTAFDLGSPFTLAPLDVGHSVTENLFKLSPSQGATGTQSFSVAFDFTQPPPPFGETGTGSAKVKKFRFFGFYYDYIKNNSIKISNPLLKLNFGANNDGELDINLFTNCFLGFQSHTITATFTLVKDPTPAKVPEPGSLALLGTGLLGLGFVARRKRRRA